MVTKRKHYGTLNDTTAEMFVSEIESFAIRHRHLDVSMTLNLKIYVSVILVLSCFVFTTQAILASPGACPVARSALLRQTTHNQVLTNHVIKNNTQKSWTRCLAACLTEDQCVSINYGGTEGICELNASHKEAHPGDVVDKEGWRYSTQEKSPVVELQQTITTTAPTTAAPTTAAPTTAAPTTAAPTTAAPTTTEKQPIDCWDIQTKSPSSTSGVYTVYPEQRSGSLQVYCDMDSDEGGWTVFQRRVDDSQDFYLTWAEYKAGFGDITRNFWLGNDALNELTIQRDYQLRIELQSFSLVITHAKYGRFRVDTEVNKYMLTVGTFYGSYFAGDSFSLTDSQYFSTKDQDNDIDTSRHCAQTYLGSWWFKSCIYACLNCPYQNSEEVPATGQGVVWGAWLGLQYSLKFAEMKIRPVEALQGKDCYDLLMMGESISGVYEINVTGRDQPLRVYCEMQNSGGGWTVFQRRLDGSQDFYLTWADYKAGFGDLPTEFWLGNDDIHLLTNQRFYQLIIVIRDWDNSVIYAHYDEFSVASEADLYRLSIGGYSGTAGDSLTSTHNGMAWTTYDRDNDLDSSRQCAQAARGAWWYNACDNSNLNGPYVPYPGSVATVGQGLIWGTAAPQTFSFYKTEMKIRPAEVGF